MALPRFFLTAQILSTETEEVFHLGLDGDDLKHAKALRLKKGEHIAVIDAASDYFECEIESAGSEGIRVRISQRKDIGPKGTTVILAQGIAKGEKMNEVICHATELGVAGFIPLACERSIVKLSDDKVSSRVKRWHAIAKSAAMQSGQLSVPEISEPMSVEELSEFIAHTTCVLVFWEEERHNSLHDSLWDILRRRRIPAEEARVVVVVGPEGGLSEAEVSHLCNANPHATTVSMGSSILRTETAGVVAPALVLYELGALS